MKSNGTDEPSFKVYDHNVITEKEERLKLCFIVLADCDCIFAKWNDFHNYTSSWRLVCHQLMQPTNPGMLSSFLTTASFWNSTSEGRLT